MHVIQELWELLQCEEVISEAEEAETVAEACMLLSQEVVSGKEVSRTLKFMGHIQGLEILILIDCGSSHTFLSDSIAQQLQGVEPLSNVISVQVANGGSQQCSAHLPLGKWSIRSCTFVSELKVLALPCFDMIVGMDWLEAFSPMRIDWLHKWISLPYFNDWVLIQGILPSIPDGTVVPLCLVQEDNHPTKHKQVWPDYITSLLIQFSSVFEEPKGLPPK